MLMMQVSRVRKCRCGSHAVVELLDQMREERIRINIDQTAGRAIASEIGGRPDCYAESVDVLHAALAGAGAHLERLVLSFTDGRLMGSLMMRCPRGSCAVPVDACHGLLTACRLRLPILFDSTGAPREERHTHEPLTVPPVFHAVLESLDLDRLDASKE
jgi:hypothetical protein